MPDPILHELKQASLAGTYLLFMMTDVVPIFKEVT